MDDLCHHRQKRNVYLRGNFRSQKERLEFLCSNHLHLPGLGSALHGSGLTKGYDSTPGETIAFACLWKRSRMRGSTNLILRGYVLQPSGTSHSPHCLWHRFWVTSEAHTTAKICPGCFQRRKTYLRGLRASTSELPLPPGSSEWILCFKHSI